MKLLSLVMIVKNSGEIIKKCLRAIKPYIQHWTILDTGSTDNTPELIVEEMKGLEGNLFKEDFIDFSTSRNRSLDLDLDANHGCEYQIVLDDSYEIRKGENLLKILEKGKYDSYAVKIGEENDCGDITSSYYSLRIIRTRLKYRFTGRVHECLTPNTKSQCIDQKRFYINDVKTVDHLVRSKNRAQRDYDLLFEDFKENPTEQRTLLLLSQTCRSLEKYKEMCFFLKKLSEQKEEIPEYRFFSLFTLAVAEHSLYEECSNFNNDDIFFQRLLKVSELFPERSAEPGYELSAILYARGDLVKALDILNKIIELKPPELYLTQGDEQIYDYKIPYLYIDVNLKLGRIDKALPLLKGMLNKRPSHQPLLNMKYAICDKPSNYIRIAPKVLVIHMGTFYNAWNPRKNIDISGSEYMAINMAKEFIKHGFRVIMFGYFVDEKEGIDYECMIENIQFIDKAKFKEFSMNYLIDYLIVSRYLENLVYYDNIGKVYLWLHDILPFTNSNSPVFQAHLEKLKGVVCLSKWHLDYVKGKIGIPDNFMILSRNAIYPERFTNNKVIKIPYQFIYMADGFRGLPYLIDMIQIIKERYPLTTLKVFCKIKDLDKSLVDKIKTLTYVSLNERVSQDRIAFELLQSDVWLYPVVFKETYCISALEAQAAGCLVASVNLAGLTTTIGDRGIMVDPPIDNKKKQAELLEKLFNVMDNPDLKQSYISKAQEWALKQTYSSLALSWIEFFKK